MSNTAFEETQQDEAGRVPDRRIFQPRTIQEIRRERGLEAASAAKSADATQTLATEAVRLAEKTPAFRRNAPRPRQSFQPAQKGNAVSPAVDDSGNLLKERIEKDLKYFPGWKVLLGLLGVVIFGIFLSGAFFLGERSGRIAQAKELASKESKAAAAPSEREREEVRARLDKAFALSQSGDADAGWKIIQGISRDYSHIPSLAYAEALVALQAGKKHEALDLAKISVARKERVAESLALQATISTALPGPSGLLQEELLWKAVDADPVNPSPLIELAQFLSSHGEDEKAESLIRSAKLRLLPVDSYAVVDSALEILKAKNLPTSSLPVATEPTGSPDKDFSIAYAAMRRGDFQTAANVLESTRKSLPPGLFDYLLNYPPIREYALEPQITRFY